MADSRGYRLFKTESIDEMPFEQYKVLIHATIRSNKEAAAAISDVSSIVPAGTAKSTTHRIVTE